MDNGVTNRGSDIYVDVVNLKGQIYRIDEWGEIREFDSLNENSPNLSQFVSPIDLPI